ncbi:MAG: hypothetical protein HY819_06580 [Acidobacteria bacterium]|nr:hypothetical protein [Acidobacteriota bacterium]
MIKSPISRKTNTIDCESFTHTPYLSVLHGEFPWCLDNSEETSDSGDLISSFDLVIADLTNNSKTTGPQKKLREKCHPNTSWISYTELFMKEHSSILVFSPLESIGTYVNVLLETGLSYHTTYLWQKTRQEKSDSSDPFVAILWASKGTPDCVVPFVTETRLINSSLIANNSPLPVIGSSEKSSLLQFLIQSFTKADMLVLEPFTSDLELMSICQKLSRYCLAISRKRSIVKQAERLLLESLQQTA